MKPKRKPPKVKSNYTLMAECVEIGLRFGYQHAHKHLDNPTEKHLCEAMLCEIMLELSGRFEL